MIQRTEKKKVQIIQNIEEKKGSDYPKYQGKGSSDYSVFPSRRKCGRPNIIINSRIVNGQKVKTNEFPWQVLLTMPCNYEGICKMNAKCGTGEKIRPCVEVQF